MRVQTCGSVYLTGNGTLTCSLPPGHDKRHMTVVNGFLTYWGGPVVLQDPCDKPLRGHRPRSDAARKVFG